MEISRFGIDQRSMTEKIVPRDLNPVPNPAPGATHAKRIPSAASGVAGSTNAA